MEVNKENIEFIKRKLKDYGYYTNAIENSEIYLCELRERIKARYKASGISYDSILSNSDPNYSKTVELINEEYSELLHKKELEKKRDQLNLNDLLKVLNSESRELIQMHYFDGLSQEYISSNKYLSRETITKKIEKILIFIVKNY